MRRLTIYLAAFILFPSTGIAQYKMSHKEYIDTYKELAIRNMKNSRIPASITLAQGILESGSGGSRLAVEANNHFGIKCKGDAWTGEKVYHDDDQKGECFRKYKNPDLSYKDHSRFLTESKRYASLFALDITDYKGWARGLKTAGYATNPKYPELLIGIIEKNNLHEYDLPEQKGLSGRKKGTGQAIGTRIRTVGLKHEVLKHNLVSYVVSRPGDSFVSIAQEFGISTRTLLRINDLKGAFPLAEGTALYVQPKRNKSGTAAQHTIEKGESYHSIAQLHGIKLKRLQKMNPITTKFAPQVGQVIRLQ